MMFIPAKKKIVKRVQSAKIPVDVYAHIDVYISFLQCLTMSLAQIYKIEIGFCLVKLEADLSDFLVLFLIFRGTCH